MVATAIGFLSAILAILGEPFTGRLAVPAHQQPVRDEECLACHQVQVTYLKTAHHLTSRLPSSQSVLGRFSNDANILRTSNPELFYRMDSTDSGLYETAIEGLTPNSILHKEQIDFVVGSGRKGQTYLYWNGSRLYELPVSYWTELDRWVTSPGYPDDVAEFNRPVPPRCLECHASYFKSVSPMPAGNSYDRSDFELGISCERCHGPGREHVDVYRAQAHTNRPDPIVNPAKLSRQRQIDTCAICHGGIGVVPLAPAFSYVPGTDLERYIALGHVDSDAPIDVHGNQVALLERSRCFQASQMTCATCHNVHVPQRDAAAFSDRCLGCHKPESCGMHAKIGPEIVKDCVTCHMPLQQSNAIVAGGNGVKLRPLVRTHWIKIYPN